jgi:hypothetical protein
MKQRKCARLLQRQGAQHQSAPARLVRQRAGGHERNIALMVFGVALASCSESATPNTSSTFQGSLSVETFPQRPESVQATNELGVVTQALVSAAGDFRMDLSRDHAYILAVNWAAERVNVVFPRATGELTSRFDVASGAALVSLGSVRYFAAVPTGGFFLSSAHVNLASTSAGEVLDQADGEVGECVNGVILGTGAVCVDDDGSVACEGDPSDGDGECDDGKDISTGLACNDPVEASDGDGECEDGIDSGTGLACSDPEDGVDPTQPMAVAEHNVPDQVGGCDEGGEEEEDD